MNEIHVFNHHAMATQFQLRIANEEKTYAAQTAQATFALTDQLESHLSRFRANSDISQLAHLAHGESLRLSEPTFVCLEIAKKMEDATDGAFSVSAAALQSQALQPQWTLLKASISIRCERGRLEFDLGAIGKGFALDRMAEVLRDWSCPAFLLIAGGSSILAGEPPPNMAGWSCGLGDDHSPHRFFLKNRSLSGSGLAVKGDHILDPRTGRPAQRQSRAWALTEVAAESDALSTACMVLNEREIDAIVTAHQQWVVFLQDGAEVKCLRSRELPLRL